MYFRLLSALILINLINSLNAIYYTISKDDYNIAGLPMQFNISVTDSAYPFFYRFDLFENVTNSSNSYDNYHQITQNYIFPNETKPGSYRLKVQVSLIVASIKIMRISGPSFIDFEIRDQLSGNIKYSQDNLRQSALKNSYVACFNQINFISQIDNFHDYFENVTFNWFINGTLVPNITDNQLNHTLNTVDHYNITTIFNVKSKNNLILTGRNELIVSAFKPLVNLNLTGIPNISWKRNKNLEIYVNFMNGTKPFWYCYNIRSDDKSKPLCNDPEDTTEDFFKVSHRFSHNGTYYLKIKAGNIVTKLEKSFPITVIDFERKSQMIIIIMPIVAFIFILIIILAGILFYINKRNKFMTEVADFNFEIRSQMDISSEETSFFQRLKNTFKNSIKDAFACHKESQTRLLENVNSVEET